RVVVFDGDGNFMTEFGSIGMSPGQFDEPVGITVGESGLVYVVDTWNQRIQVFSEQADGSFGVLRYWDVIGWYGQSLDNKPYLAVDDQGFVYATDPEGYRVLKFDDAGEIVLYWGDYGAGASEFGLAGGVATDAAGGVWVTDSGNNRIMYFNFSERETVSEE
ncbi:MAG: hypothetical protein U9R60_18515, partial [Bacteroidota bacterium]|nr:hypothetical protein [Bacteroidota bacterium]